MANPAFIFINPTVTIGTPAADVTCELSKAELTPAITMKDAGSLCGPAELPGDIKWTLDLEGFQSYATADLSRYLFDHRRETVPFTLVCKDEAVSATNPEISGDVVCVPGQFGGTQSEIAVFTASLPLVGEPTFSDTASMAATSSTSGSSSSSTSGSSSSQPATAAAGD